MYSSISDRVRPIMYRGASVSQNLGAVDTNEKLLIRLVYKLGRSLGSLRSGTQALLGGADNDPDLRTELLSEMDFQLDDLQRILDNIVQYMAIQRHAVRLQKELVQPAGWLQQLAEEWQGQHDNRGLSWEIEIPGSLPPVVIDRDRLEQALENLLANAIRYSAEGGSISLRASGEGGRLRVELSNPAAQLYGESFDRVFDPLFPSLDRSRFPTSLGLGLYVARQLVEAQGGKLELEGSPAQTGQMSFVVSLPSSTERRIPAA